jgi:hypothetical protein
MRLLLTWSVQVLVLHVVRLGMEWDLRGGGGCHTTLHRACTHITCTHHDIMAIAIIIIIIIIIIISLLHLLSLRPPPMHKNRRTTVLRVWNFWYSFGIYRHGFLRLLSATLHTFVKVILE